LTLYQVLEAVGVKDLSVYAEVPGAELAPDFFVEVSMAGWFWRVSKCCTCLQAKDGSNTKGLAKL